MKLFNKTALCLVALLSTTYIFSCDDGKQDQRITNHLNLLNSRQAELDREREREKQRAHQRNAEMHALVNVINQHVEQQDRDTSSLPFINDQLAKLDTQLLSQERLQAVAKEIEDEENAFWDQSINTMEQQLGIQPKK